MSTRGKYKCTEKFTTEIIAEISKLYPTTRNKRIFELYPMINAAELKYQAVVNNWRKANRKVRKDSSKLPTDQTGARQSTNTIIRKGNMTVHRMGG